MDTVTIKGTEYRLKYSLRNYLVYEQITGVSFTPDKTLNIYTLFFCVLLTNNDSFKLRFDEFMDALDEDQQIFLDFGSWLKAEIDKRQLLAGDKEEQPSKSGKKKRSR